jgi:sugar/nucleoside kinase (ribokinase family)
MLPDRGVAPTFSPEELDPAWLLCDHLHVSGYALFVPPVRDAALEAVGLARAAGARVSVDLSSWSGIRDAGPDSFRELVTRLGPDVVFANDAEVAAVGGPWQGPQWIVKRGAAGCSFDGDERSALPTTVVDTTGAGDALAAGWILGGPQLALEAAARCVAMSGAMPRDAVA